MRKSDLQRRTDSDLTEQIKLNLIPIHAPHLLIPHSQRTTLHVSQHASLYPIFFHISPSMFLSLPNSPVSILTNYYPFQLSSTNYHPFRTTFINNQLFPSILHIPQLFESIPIDGTFFAAVTIVALLFGSISIFPQLTTSSHPFPPMCDIRDVSAHFLSIRDTFPHLQWVESNDSHE
ncbi:hypothetical protein BLNAU_14002 [Blattamonas nauphoetae]|uniref:Uncharacterized protein n=1 Tax=Blattamonas nauphoetae TaxID=2049346 RepID=A0ABQ9XLB8_9EUKA|nr:hypothetical protein BLNAU_14002 [Blattamonas nauphoetae]